MASILCNNIQNCFRYCYTNVIETPLEVCSEIRQIQRQNKPTLRQKCSDTASVILCCGSTFCCYTTITCIFNIPPILLGFSDLPNLIQTLNSKTDDYCPASIWLGIFWMFCIAHIWASFYIMSQAQPQAHVVEEDEDKVEESTTSTITRSQRRVQKMKHIFCYDGWMAIYMLICCAYVAWLLLGGGLFVDVSISDNDTCGAMSLGMFAVAYCFGWAFVIFGGCTLCCSLGCGLIHDEEEEDIMAAETIASPQQALQQPAVQPEQQHRPTTTTIQEEDGEDVLTSSSTTTTTVFQWQMALCYLSFTTTYLMSNTIPYAPFLTVHLLPNYATAENVGKYSAFFTSCYIWGRSTGAGFWGQVADIRGRKPILLSSLVFGGIFTLLFGLSDNYFVALLMRFCMGLFCDIASLVKTCVTEHAHATGSSNHHDDLHELEAHSMNLVISAWAAGTLLSPAIGGALSDPVDNYPNLFGEETSTLVSPWARDFLIQYPYFLPNLVGFLLSLIGVIITRLFIKETLVVGRPQSQRRQQQQSSSIEEGQDDHDAVVNERSSLLPKAGDGEFSVGRPGGESFVEIGPEALKFAREQPNLNSTLRDSYYFSDELEGVMTSDEFRTSFAQRSSSALIAMGPSRGPFTKSSKRLVPSIKPATIAEDQVLAEEETNAAAPPTTMTFLLDPETRNHLIVYCIGCFVIMFHMEAFPLFCLSQDSGLGVSEGTIGGIMLASGITHALLQPSIYACIFARTGLKGSIRWASTLFIPVFLIIPASLWSKGVGEDQLRWTSLTFLGVVIGLGRTFTVTFASSISVSLNHLVIPQHRATFNGLLMRISGGCKGSAPIMAGFFTAWAFTSGVVPSHGWGAVLLYCSLGLVGLILAAASHLLLGSDEHF